MRRRQRLTPEELQECRALKSAWLSWRDRNGQNQQWFADQLGISQGAVSHYLNGRNAVNAGLLVKVKKVLGIDPAQISPRIAAQLAPVTGKSDATFEVLDPSERDLVAYIRAHNGASMARQLLIAARALLERPVSDEKVEAAGFNASKRRKTVRK